MKMRKINLRLAAILLFLIGGTAAMVRAHQNGRCGCLHKAEAAADSTILINSQQGISVQPVTRLSQ